ncbi:hypothetical protein Dsin_015923 [Dipteronia sinensis]|uniref:Ubiquitin-like domain-containing protein n=1 Tax=Dipteronia sinensis TaxID=43782 RepID=A0AAE0ADD4_9ROSI|nr:hypothetical protein Dsin_015923 [Dipteronia sinensis]
MATVQFRITGGEVTPEITMPISATILDLKERIQLFTGIVMTRQTLRFNNQELTNDRTIGHYGFGQFATLVLDVKPLNDQFPKFYILVKSCNEQSKMIKVKETTLVGDLRSPPINYYCLFLFLFESNILSLNKENHKQSKKGNRRQQYPNRNRGHTRLMVSTIDLESDSIVSSIPMSTTKRIPLRMATASAISGEKEAEMVWTEEEFGCGKNGVLVGVNVAVSVGGCVWV